MKRKYQTRCWLCDSTDLEPDERGIKCRSCGATYNVIPKPGSLPLTIVNNPQCNSYQPKQETYFKPSAVVQQYAAKARQATNLP